MNIKLKVEKREKKEKLSKGLVAGNLYGPSIKPVSLKLNLNEFIKVYSLAGESNLIELDLDGKKEKVLIKEIQKDPIKNFIVHIDLYQVDMSKVVSTEIPLRFIGESKAVKELGGLLIKNLNELSIECLPADLIDHIDVDISELKNLGDAIHVSNIFISDKIKVLNNLGDSVVTVIEPKEDKAGEKSTETVVEAKKDAKTDNKSEAKKDNKK